MLYVCMTCAGGPRPPRAQPPPARPPPSDAVLVLSGSSSAPGPVSNGVPRQAPLDEGRDLQAGPATAGGPAAAAAAGAGGNAAAPPPKKQGSGLVVKLSRPEGSGDGGAAAQPAGQIKVVRATCALLQRFLSTLKKSRGSSLAGRPCMSAAAAIQHLLLCLPRPLSLQHMAPLVMRVAPMFWHGSRGSLE